MKKIRVYVKSELVYMDNRVYVDIFLPSIPRIGEKVNIGWKNLEILTNDIKSSLETALDYFPQYFILPDEDRDREIRESDLDRLDLEFICIVENVDYFAGEDFVGIHLGKNI